MVNNVHHDVWFFYFFPAKSKSSCISPTDSFGGVPTWVGNKISAADFVRVSFAVFVLDNTLKT